MYSGGAWHAAALVVREDLRAGDLLSGPAIIAEKNATTVVEPGWEARVTALDHLERLTRLMHPPYLPELVRSLGSDDADLTAALRGVRDLVAKKG